MNIYQIILDKRKQGEAFSKIRKDLVSSKKFEETEIIKAIGSIHDHEANVIKATQELKKGRSFFIGGSIVFILSTVYTLFTYFSETLSYYVLLYGPILAGFFGAAIGLEKYRSSKSHIQTLENKFDIKKPRT